MDRPCHADCRVILGKNGPPWLSRKIRDAATRCAPDRVGPTDQDATVKRFYYETHNELRIHLADFVSAYNFAKRLETLKGLTSYEYICKTWAKGPERITLNPLHQMPGLNI